MILKQLQLKNFRRFRSLDLEFSENVQGLVGPNGAGKTSIVEAIAWALYGTRATRGSKTDIRSREVEGQEPCEVCLVFEISGTQYNVQRTLRGKTAVAEAAVYSQESSEPLAVQESGVNAYIEKTVGLDYRSFFASVFARQKDLAAIGDMRPEERRLAVNRLINIDAIDRARKMAMEQRTAADNQMRGMSGMLKDIDALTKEIGALESTVTHEQAAVDLAKKGVDEAFKTLENSKAAYKEMNDRRDSWLAANTALGALNAEMDSAGKQLKELAAELQKIARSSKDLAELEPRRRQYLETKAEKERLERLRSEASRAHKLHEELQYHDGQIEAEQAIVLQLQKAIASGPDPDSAMDALNDRRETLRQEETRLHGEHKAAVAELGAIRSRGKTSRARKNEIERLGRDGPCPTCSRPLGDHFDQVVSDLGSEIDELLAAWRAKEEAETDLSQKLDLNRRAREKLQKEREKLQESITVVRGKREELRKTRERLSQFKKKRDEISAELRALGEIEFEEGMYLRTVSEFEKLTKVHEHAIRLTAQVDRKPEVEERERAVKEKTISLEGSIQERQKELDSLAYDEKAYAQAHAQYENDRETLDGVRGTLADAEKALVGSKAQLGNKKAELDQAKADRAEYERLQEDRLVFESLAHHFGRFRLELSGRLRPLIAARASRLLRLTTKGRYTLLELDEDYNISMVDQHESYPLQRFSGGEQDLANLCLRVAISQVVAERSGKSPVQFIVLDEVFGSQDSDRRALIMDSLQQLQSQFRQIFLISHLEQIKEALPVVIQVDLVSALQSRAQVI